MGVLTPRVGTGSLFSGEVSVWIICLERGASNVQAQVFVREENGARLVATLSGSLRAVVAGARFALIRELGPDAAWDLFRSTLADVERNAL